VLERRAERRWHQPSEASERSRSAFAIDDLDRPERVTQALVQFLEPVDERIGGTLPHQPWEKAHHQRVTVHLRKWNTITVTPLPQEQPRRLQNDPRLARDIGHSSCSSSLRITHS
jgi:hypothetical protein